MNIKIIYLVLLIFLNSLLYLSLNFFYLNLSYLILTILISLNFYSLFEFKKLKKKENSDLNPEVTAADHPIIKAAKQRLNK